MFENLSKISGGGGMNLLFQNSVGWARSGDTLFFKQRFFSTHTQCCLTFSWTELQRLLMCCLIHLSIIRLRHLYLQYSCPCLDVGLFMPYLFDLFFIFIFIFTDTLLLLLIFWNMYYYSSMITWMKNVNNFQITKVQPQDVA